MGPVGSVQSITPSTNLTKKISSVRTFPNLPAVITYDKNPRFFAIVMWVYSSCFCTWFLPGPSVIWHISGLSCVQIKSSLSSLPGATVLYVLFPTFWSSYILATGTWSPFFLPHLGTQFLGLRMLSYFSHFSLSLAQLLSLPDFSVSRISLFGVHTWSVFPASIFSNSAYASCKF